MTVKRNVNRIVNRIAGGEMKHNYQVMAILLITQKIFCVDGSS